MDPELQAQITHLISLLNSLDRKLDNLGSQIGAELEALNRKLDDMADQLAIEIIDND